MVVLKILRGKRMRIGIKKNGLIILLIVFIIGTICFVNSKNAPVLAKAEVDTGIGQWVIEHDTIISYTGSETSILIPESHEGVQITKIGNNAFKSNKNITKVQIPNTIVEIGDRAFENCSKLTEVELSRGLSNIGDYAFSDCVALKEIVIPSSLESIGGIGGYVFNGCKGLEKVVIEEGVKSIGEYAFYQCEELKTVKLPSTLEKIDTWAFGFCKKLLSIDLPTSLKVIGSAAFYYCNELNNIVIPNSVTEIGTHSFRDCWNLSNLKLSTSLKTIPFRAFSGCKALLQVEFFEGLEKIGDEAFYQSGIQSFVAPNTLTDIGANAFFECKQLKTFKSSDALSFMGEGAFASCSSLSTVDLSSSLKSIPNGSFKDCISLKQVLFPNTLTRIGDNAFQNCEKLYFISLPASLESIGSEAFNGCYKLVEIHNLSSLSINCGDNQHGEIGAFAICVHQSLSEASHVRVDENGYIFYVGKDSVLLVGYLGEQTELVLPSNFSNGSYQIRAYAFNEDQNIISIKIPKAVTKIGKNAFNGCSNLTNIMYLGNNQDWKQVVIEEGNTCLRNVRFISSGNESNSSQKPSYIYNESEGISFFTKLKNLWNSCINAAIENIFAVNFILILIWGILLIYTGADENSDSKKRKKLIFVILAGAQWVLISGLRADSIGADTENYMRFFDNHSLLSWREVFQGIITYAKTGDMGTAWYMETEPLFIIFNKAVSVVTTNHVTYKFLIAIIFMSAFGSYVYKYSDDACMSFAIYGALFFNMFSLTGYRQVLSVALILFGWRYIKEQRLIPFLFVLLVAYFLHRTTLIFILLYFLANKKMTPLYIFGIIVILSIATVFRSEIFELVKSFVGYDEYVGNYGFKQQTFAILLLGLTAVAAWQYKYIIRKNPEAIQYYNGLILAWLMFPLAMESPSCMRLVYDYGFVILLLVPLMVKSFEKQEDRIIMNSGIYLLFAYQVITSEFSYAFFWQ